MTTLLEWFQLLMNDVLRSVIGKKYVVYLDDIIIYSKTLKQHIKDIGTVFDLLRKAVLQIKVKKCKFIQRKLKFLGHEVSKEGVHTDPDKIKIIKDRPPLRNLTEVQSVMG